MAARMKTAKRGLMAKSVGGIIENKFRRTPGSTVCIVAALIQECGPYQASQSPRSRHAVARTSRPEMMRKTAMFSGDWGSKKNLFHAAGKDLRLTANPRAALRSGRKRPDRAACACRCRHRQAKCWTI